MRTRAAHLGPDKRRPLILDAALPLFAREGYDAVSMQEIVAQRSGRPEREALVLARLLVSGAELGFTVMLDQPGVWEPEELADFLARTAIRGMRASTPSGV